MQAKVNVTCLAVPLLWQHSVPSAHQQSLCNKTKANNYTLITSQLSSLEVNVDQNISLLTIQCSECPHDFLMLHFELTMLINSLIAMNGAI